MIGLISMGGDLSRGNLADLGKWSVKKINSMNVKKTLLFEARQKY